MSASKVALYAYVDETGNTGHNVFDTAQPDFYTAAMITKGDFDLAFSTRIEAIAQRCGVQGLHGNVLGAAKLEAVAFEIVQVLRAAKPTFFVSRVEKKYLLATKVFDSLFDSGENAAVAWHHYNLKPLRLMMTFKVASILDLETAKLFWQCLLEKSERKALAMLPGVCERLIGNLPRLPDERSREILREGLEWAAKHPESIQIHQDRKLARQGHFPNLVAFANLLDGLEDHSQRLKRPVARVTHDEQSEFKETLTAWHSLFANASPEPFKWAGETHRVQRLAGSTFEVRADETSPGIQITDMVLWLYRQFHNQKPLPSGCRAILNYVLENGWENDFSFSGVERMYLEKWQGVLEAPLSADREDAARQIIADMERSRLKSMERYEHDKLPPFMRPDDRLPPTENPTSSPATSSS